VVPVTVNFRPTDCPDCGLTIDAVELLAVGSGFASGMRFDTTAKTPAITAARTVATTVHLTSGLTMTPDDGILRPNV